MRLSLKCAAASLVAVMSTFTMHPEVTIDYRGEIIENLGTGDFAPYYMASNVYGTVTQPYSTLLRASLSHSMSRDSRFSYGFGADVIGGYSSKTNYDAFIDGKWVTRGQGPAPIWLQQLYAEVKFRGLFMTAGMKETGSAMLDDNLSSGDITWSANSRPMPGIRIGFIDFQNIPLTNGWLQIDAVLFYGKPHDNNWLRDHFNHYNSFITSGRWNNYKRLYLRTNPSQPFSATFGMQAAAQFAGTCVTYRNGEIMSEVKAPLKLRDFCQMIIPRHGEYFYRGNHLGTWDIALRYRLCNGNEVRAYLQSPWEDGSGIGKMNGFDGLWGLEFRASKPGFITGAVFEYLDFTNQSGPLHWSTGDHPGTTITDEATGSDSYYNNYFYNGYACYGMSQGTPFIPSPLYNLDGYMRYADTRVRGFHAALRGNISSEVDYRMMISHRTGRGDSYLPRLHKVRDTSIMLEGIYKMQNTPEMDLKCQLAWDHGNMYGNNFGILVTISYKGSFNIGGRR